ncbi:spore germination protein [Cohnella sp. GbtcB17]|uniref:spore germination protein n=1 Tax=Cohnella sp. GbtcB17 TaxID=2824762 RepID=UPI001C306C54|nr:spore germination protein [Cohnella sp. GbtcB17]
MIKETLEKLKASADFQCETLDNGRFQIELCYFSSLSDKTVIKKEVAHPFQHAEATTDYCDTLSAALSCEKLVEDADPMDDLLKGFVLIRVGTDCFSLDAAKTINNQPLETSSEMTLQGPQSGYSEDTDTNLLITRKRYPYPTLVAEKRQLGSVSRTKAYMLYDKEKVNPDILRRLSDMLDAIKAETVMSTGQLEALITDTKLRWLPTMLVTERPDRVVYNLAQGKIVILLDGTPYSLIAPVVFYDFLSAMDDMYQSFIVSRALILMRYVALLITITLPGLYVAVVSYNPQIFRVQFALSVAGSRAAVPYPSFIEVLIMLFLIEALVEASLRLPSYIGSTATTVGGLILGQAAQMAGLVSSIMIIITSAVAISNFVVPINTMSFAVRIAKYPLVLLASLFGLAGLVSGMFALALYTTNLENFGQPYFRLFIGEPAVAGYKDSDTD